MRVGGFVDMSTVDWYGNVSLVVFFAGCNFRCPYCQNPALIPLNSGRIVDKEAFQDRIKMSVNLLDAVVFTGGEPLIQPKNIMDAAKIVKDFDLKLMLDTNGSEPKALKTLLEAGVLDRVALDVKAPLNPVDYKRVAGLSQNEKRIVDNIKTVLNLCNNYGVELEVRTTVAPNLSDDAEFIRNIAKDIKGRFGVYYLQQFDNMGEVLSPEMKSLKPPSREKMVELAESTLDEGLKDVYVKTREMGLERVG